jgi:hypothetical protein
MWIVVHIYHIGPILDRTSAETHLLSLLDAHFIRVFHTPPGLRIRCCRRSYVRSISLHFCKRLFLGLKHITAWSQGNSFTTVPGLPFDTIALANNKRLNEFLQP